MATRNLIDVNLTGIKELDRALRKLGPAVEKRVQSQALRAGARPIIRQAKSLLMMGARRPRKGKRGKGFHTGNLYRSMAVKTIRGMGGWAAIIGPKWPGGVHGHLVEFGTKPRYHKSGKFVGAMPARPFLRPAFDMALPEAKRRIREVVEKGIAREARRARGG